MLPGKVEDITPKTVALDGNNEWLFSAQFRELGGDRQRSDSKRCSSQEEAKRLFNQKADFFCKSMAHLPHVVIDRKEAELLITVNGIKTVQMSCLVAPRQCA